MTPRLAPAVTLTVLAGLTSACAIDVSGDDMSHAERISINADRAVQACGPDNVGSVDTKGYTCEAGASARD